MRIQGAARKIKNKLFQNEYMNIYRTGSSTREFYLTAKKHKPVPTWTIDYVSMRPIISYIGTASNQSTKHLTKLLSPLNKLEYTVADDIESVNSINQKRYQPVIVFYPLMWNLYF